MTERHKRLGASLNAPLSPEGSHVMHVRVSPALYAELKNEADARGWTLSRYLRHLLRHRPLF